MASRRFLQAWPWGCSCVLPYWRGLCCYSYCRVVSIKRSSCCKTWWYKSNFFQFVLLFSRSFKIRWNILLVFGQKLNHMESVGLFLPLLGNPLVLSKRNLYGTVLHLLRVFKGLTNFRIGIQWERSQGSITIQGGKGVEAQEWQ